MMNSWPLVYILIISYNGEKYVLRLLESLSRSTYPNSRTLLIDNNSTDDTVQNVHSHYPDCRIRVNPANLGFGRAGNLGIREAIDDGADFILLMNQDTLVHEAMIQRLVGFMASHPKAACVGPKTYYLEKKTKRTNRILYAGAWRKGLPLMQHVRGINQVDAGQYDRACRVDFVWGHGMLMRCSALGKTGFFDPDIFMYYEDIDLCVRLQQDGYEIWYEPAAVMWHQIPDGARATRSELWRWQHKTISLQHLFKKHYGTCRGVLLFAAFFAFETVAQLKASHLQAIHHRFSALWASPFFPFGRDEARTAADKGKDH
jgi:GT2 family glycosyltransferase